jgi:hypothetical protein
MVGLMRILAVACLVLMGCGVAAGNPAPQPKDALAVVAPLDAPGDAGRPRFDYPASRR